MSVDAATQEWKEDVISEAISCLKNTLSLTSSRESLKGQILDIQDYLMRTGLIIVGMEPKLKQWACVSMAPVSPSWLPSTVQSWHEDQEAEHGGLGRGTLTPGVKEELKYYFN